MNGLGNMLVGVVMLVNALSHVHIEWSWDKVVLSLVLFLSATITRTAINLVNNSLSFWTHAPNNALPMMVSSLAEFTKFPITIYSYGVQLFFSLVLPYAFVFFFPRSLPIQQRTMELDRAAHTVGGGLLYGSGASHIQKRSQPI